MKRPKKILAAMLLIMLSFSAPGLANKGAEHTQASLNSKRAAGNSDIWPLDATLLIWDTEDSETILQNKTVTFFAGYMDLANNSLIPNASCNISFDDNSSSLMRQSANNRFYYFKRNFTKNRSYSYTITCQSTGQGSSAKTGKVSVRQRTVPQILSASNTRITDKAEISIIGKNFRTKPTPQPILWDDFESGNFSAGWSGIGTGCWQIYSGPELLNGSDYAYRFDHSTRSSCAMLKKYNVSSRLYVYDKRRYDYSMRPDNHKFLRIWQRSNSQSIAWAYLNGRGYQMRDSYSLHDDPYFGPAGWNYILEDEDYPKPGEWQTEEFYVKLESETDAFNGVMAYRVNNHHKMWRENKGMFTDEYNGTFYRIYIDNYDQHLTPETHYLTGSCHEWYNSSKGRHIQYVKLICGYDMPNVTFGLEPTDLFINGTPLVQEHDFDDLAEGEWYWGDEDSLGFDTIYINHSIDPDTQSVLYVTYLINKTGDYVWVDDVYIDDSWAHVMIGENKTYQGCRHLEIQLPTAWNDTAINVTIRRGSFSEGETAYLYITDEFGEVNEAGYEIRFGSSLQPADTDGDGRISNREMKEYAKRWKMEQANISFQQLMQALLIWKNER